MSAPQVTTGQEIERKFLVAELPYNYGNFPAKQILQGYVALDPNGTEVRLRNSNGIYTMTAKAGVDAMVRDEPEAEVDEAFFQAFWPLTLGRRVVKTRYEIPLDQKHTAELDIFAGNLAGLQIVEVEFPTVPAAQAFRTPDWFGLEVTTNRLYKNKNMALNRPPILSDPDPSQI